MSPVSETDILWKHAILIYAYMTFWSYANKLRAKVYLLLHKK